MTHIVPLEQQVPAFAMGRADLIRTLQNSVYPGAQRESVELVIGYCQAQRLDPLQKPVHIVPMWDKNLKAMRDVLMPGIGLYRTQASRTCEHAGTTEPEFGPMMVRKWGDFSLDFPEWCKVTVYRRLTTGETAAFTATEYWTENYATASKDSTVPNAMWKKRPRGQLAKCAEAQALRKAFPELGSAPTAEEMEGKAIDVDDVAEGPSKPTPNEFMPAAKAERHSPPAGAIDVDPETGEVDGATAVSPPEDATPASSKKAPSSGDLASAGMIKTVRSAMSRTGKSDSDFVKAWGFSPDELPNSMRNEVMSWARAS